MICTKQDAFWDVEIPTPNRRHHLVIFLEKRENLLNSRLCRTSGPQKENQREQKKRQLHGPS